MNSPMEPNYSRLSRILFPGLIAIVICLCYLPALDNDFVNWDDDLNFIDNPHYRGLGLANIRWMFTAFHSGHYHPVTWLTLGLDYVFWGMDPRGYHLSNLIFHIATAILFYFLLLVLLPELSAVRIDKIRLYPAAAIGALFFAVHPLRVESVAWITERRDVVCGVFLLATVLGYLKWHHCRQWKWYWLSLAFFVLSLLSKVWGVTLPVVLLLLDIYPLRRFSPPGRESRWRIVAEKIPYLVLAMASSLQALATFPVESHPLLVRTIFSSHSLCFYIAKTIAPFNLSPIYAFDYPFVPLAPKYLLCSLLVVATALWILTQGKKWPGVSVALLSYAVIISPVMGFFQNGAQCTADRFSYISTLPLAVLVAAIVYRLSNGRSRATSAKQYAIYTVAIIVTAGLGFLTWQQTFIWRNSFTLWQHALKIDPANCRAYNLLGMAYKKQGQLDTAIGCYRRALSIRSDYSATLHNLAVVLEHQGHLVEATEYYQKAVELHPKNAQGHYCLGNILQQRRQLPAAIWHYREAIRLKADYPQAYNGLGVIWEQKKLYGQAILCYQKAIALQPDHIRARYNLGNVLAQSGRLDEAIFHYREVIRQQPDYAYAYNNLGALFEIRSQPLKAIEYYRHALSLDPGLHQARKNLTRLSQQQRKPR